jgi:prophage regulatory protein
MSETKSQITPKLLLDIADVCAMVGMGERTVYRMIAAGNFPRPKQIPGFKGNRWAAVTVRRWCDRLADREAVNA